MIEKLREKYGTKITTLTEKVRRAQEKMGQQKQQATMQKAESYISVGATILGAILGKGVSRGTISQAGTTMRRVGKISKEEQEAAHAENDYKAAQQQLEDIQNELHDSINDITNSIEPGALPIEKINIKPRKTDITVDKVALVWWPV
jgi:multidrug resistance efflux pump